MRLHHSLRLQLILFSAIAACVVSRARAAEPPKTNTAEPTKTNAAEPAKTQSGEPANTHKVTSGGLTLYVPESWVSKKTTGNFKLMQFSIAKTEGDTHETDCVVWYYGLSGAGSVNEIAQRWIDEFQPKDRKLKITTGKCRYGVYTLVDISGTWNRPVGTPEGGLKIVHTPGGRLLGVALPDSYAVLLGGPEKTVEANADALRIALGADVKAEKPYQVPATKGAASTAAAEKPAENKGAADKAAAEKAPAEKAEPKK